MLKLVIALSSIVLVCVAAPTSQNTSIDYNDDEYTDDELVKGGQHNSTDFEKYLDKILSVYYEKYVAPVYNGTKTNDSDDIYEQMQSDQPVDNNQINLVNVTAVNNLTSADNFSDYYATMRERNRDNWIQIIKENLLKRVGRVNITVPKTVGHKLNNLNVHEIIHNLHNASIMGEDHITEKIRSYYPSCDIPRNTDQEVWKDENAMNLYFNFDHASEETGVNIATATLRLYRLPQENNGTNNYTLNDNGCDNFSLNEDDKLIRISIYWYTRSLRKHRVKRKLCDSKVINENSKWVELSVKPATRAWTKGRNLGLAVLVEDQDGAILKADKYFKGASCTVGTSTPKPIPTIILDEARRTSEFDRLNGVLGQNTTATLYSDISLLPTIDVCTLEFPDNNTQLHHTLTETLRTKACNLQRLHEQNLKSAEKDRLERFVTLPGLRHIRHQRQHLAEKWNDQKLEVDPRSKIIGQHIVITHDQLQKYNLGENENFTKINR